MEDKKIKCDEPGCEKIFKTIQGMASHYKWKHEWQYGCPLCEGGKGSACNWHFM